MITHLATREELACGEVTVTGSAYRHLFRARRLAAGERLRVADGHGGARWAVIESVGRERAVLRLGEAAPANEPAYRLELIVAALRPERASWLVEKATELGACAVRFVACRRTPRRYGSASLERLRRVAASALAQCHRARLPEVTGVDPWQALEELLAPAGDRCYLDPGGAAPASWQRRASSGAVVIGPEGGLAPEETAELARLGCVAVGLGPRILRVETAALAAVARWL